MNEYDSDDISVVSLSEKVDSTHVTDARSSRSDAVQEEIKEIEKVCAIGHR